MFNETINFLLATLTAVFLITGCSPEDRTSGGEIEALYWHENNRYTAVTINADVVSNHRIPPWGKHARAKNVTLFTDLGPEEKSWYKCNWSHSNWNGADMDTAYCEMHIHNLDELGTADWSHGKFGSGATTRID